MIDTVNDKDPLPGDVSSSSKIEAIPDVGDERKTIGEDKGQSFAALMQNPSQAGAPTKTPAVSPFDLPGIGAKPINTPSVDTLMHQANLAENTLTTIQKQLSQPNLKLKASQKYLVKNKLTDVNGHLRAANAKMGISPEEATAKAKAETGGGPIAQYLEYVSDGLNQINSAKRQLAHLSAQKGSLSPADFMLMQLKINKAQQELEFTSSVLAKSIEGFKTIMGVQI